ncbi:MAG: hypothetical protein SGILL_002350 [Bacillariaceae sp.]
MSTTPVPFPLVQMARTLVMVYVFTLPLVFLGDGNSNFWEDCITTFLLTYGFLGLDTTAVELDDPFGDDANDFDVAAYAQFAIDDVIILIYDADGEEWADALRYKMNDEPSSPADEHSGLVSYQEIGIKYSSTGNTSPSSTVFFEADAMKLAIIRVVSHLCSLSMEGYIFNANRVLEACLDPNTKEVPVELVEGCKGVVVMTMVQVGAIVTLQYGTGVMMKKTETGWSAPSSVSVGGTSFGAVVGGQRLNYIIFIMDDENMEDFVLKPQSRISLDASVTAGPMGAKGNIGNEAPKSGTVTFTLQEGFLAGLSVEMFTLESKATQNEIFYGKEGVRAQDILYHSNHVTVPEGSQIPDIQEKMEKLARGETWTPDEEAIKRSRHFASEAKRMSEMLSSGQLSASGKPEESK